jgi:hypothetical protein
MGKLQNSIFKEKSDFKDQTRAGAGGARTLWASGAGGSQVSQPTGPPIFQSAGLFAGRARQVDERSAGWETRDTADWEVCGTKKTPIRCSAERGSFHPGLLPPEKGNGWAGGGRAGRIVPRSVVSWPPLTGTWANSKIQSSRKNQISRIKPVRVQAEPAPYGHLVLASRRFPNPLDRPFSNRRVCLRAGRARLTNGLRVGKPAIRQTGKSAVRKKRP